MEIEKKTAMAFLKKYYPSMSPEVLKKSMQNFREDS
jgi:hypothetical protein